MDKYQNIFFEYAFNDYKKQELHLKNITSLKSGEVCGDFDIANEKVNVNQEKDITSTVYKGGIPAFYRDTLVFKSAYVSYGGEWEETALTECATESRGRGYEKLGYEFKFDFDNRIKKIRLCLAGGLADDLILNVTYSETDKEAYYKAQREFERKKLIDGANIEYNGCMNFIAVYFTPCNENYASAEMDLFWGEDKFMATYKSVPNNFSLMAMGLRHGEYNFVFRQKDKSGKIIFQTDKIPVKVSDSSDRKNYVYKLHDI